MLRKFLLPLLVIATIAQTAWSQTPELIAPPRFEANWRTPLGCLESNAGGTVRTLGPVNKNKSDIRYLCLGDTLFLTPNGTANLTNDSVPATPPGIGYFLYTCKPTISGPKYPDFERDPCLLRDPLLNLLVATKGEPSGRDTFFNGGLIQRSFGSGKPTKLYFAPVTMTNFFGTGGGLAGFDGTGNCLNANVNDRMTPTDTFSVVYLNAVKVKIESVSATGGRFTILGGLPEYDGTSNYTLKIALTSNPAIQGTITSGLNPRSGGLVIFTVPQEGNYTITATDGKSCDGRASADFRNVCLQVSNETVRQGDTACVKISARNFRNMVSMQAGFQYDPSIVKIVDVRNTNLTGLDAMTSFNNPSANVISLSWNGPRTGTTRADDVTLFEICFKAIGPLGAVSPIRITDTIVGIVEVADSGDVVIANVIKNGSVTIGALDYTITSRADSARCFGENGKFRVTIAGVGAPFRYTWQSATNSAQNGAGTINTTSDTAFVLNRPAGKYYITVTNAANLTKVDSVEIKQPNALFLNPPTAVNPTCANDSDGSLTLARFGGGTPSYSFLWSTGATTVSITNLAAGPYGVTITDSKGCTESIPRFTLGIDPITITTSPVTDAKCKGLATGAVSITSVQGGTTTSGAYNFKWSTGATNVGASSTISNLNPGTYYVTVTDKNLCEKKDSFKVGALRIVEANAIVSNISCFGQANGLINAIASTRGPEAQPYSFTWTGIVGAPVNTATTSSVRSLTAGTYNLTIRDVDLCQFDTAFTIIQPDSIRIALTTLTNESCRGTGGANGFINVTVSGGTPRYKYAWSRNGILDTFPIISSLVAGNYILTVTDGAGCPKTQSFTINAPLYPKIDSFRIRNATCSDRNDGSAKIFYTPATGTRIDSIKWSNTGFLDSISPVLAGKYTVTITADNGCKRTDTARITSPARLQIDTAKLVKVPELSYGPHYPYHERGYGALCLQMVGWSNAIGGCFCVFIGG
jgi:hypothetical protein